MGFCPYGYNTLLRSSPPHVDGNIGLQDVVGCTTTSVGGGKGVGMVTVGTGSSVTPSNLLTGARRGDVLGAALSKDNLAGTGVNRIVIVVTVSISGTGVSVGRHF